jgi:hypothetical protein
MKKASAGIYMPLGADGFELCQPVNHDDFEKINLEVNGHSIKHFWTPIPVAIIHEDEGKLLSFSDSPWLGAHALIFRSEAVKLMGSMLEEYGETLSLACHEAEIYIYNPIRIIDAVDENASSIVRFADGSVMMISKYVLFPEVIANVEIFKIKNLRVSPTFVSNLFVDRWNENGLKGLEFRKIWSPQKS